MAGSGRYRGQQRVKPRDSLANDTSAHSYKIEEVSREPAKFRWKKFVLDDIEITKKAIDDLAKELHDEYAQPTFIECYGGGIHVVEIKDKKYIALRRIKKPNCGSSRFVDVLDLRNKKKKKYDLVQFRLYISGKKLEQDGPEEVPQLDELEQRV